MASKPSWTIASLILLDFNSTVRPLFVVLIVRHKLIGFFGDSHVFYRVAILFDFAHKVVLVYFDRDGAVLAVHKSIIVIGVVFGEHVELFVGLY